MRFSITLYLSVLILFSALLLSSCTDETTELTTNTNDIKITQQDPDLPPHPDNAFLVKALSVLSPGTDSVDFHSGIFTIKGDPSFRAITTLYTPGVYGLYYNREIQLPVSAETLMEQISFNLRNIAVGTKTLPDNHYYVQFGVFRKTNGGIQKSAYASILSGSFTIHEYDESKRYIKASFDFRCRVQFSRETLSSVYHFKSETFKAFF